MFKTPVDDYRGLYYPIVIDRGLYYPVVIGDSNNPMDTSLCWSHALPQVLVGIGLIEICACLCLMQAGVPRDGGEFGDFWVPERSKKRGQPGFLMAIYSILFWDRREHPLEGSW